MGLDPTTPVWLAGDDLVEADAEKSDPALANERPSICRTLRLTALSKIWTRLAQTDQKKTNSTNHCSHHSMGIQDAKAGNKCCRMEKTARRCWGSASGGPSPFPFLRPSTGGGVHRGRKV